MNCPECKDHPIMEELDSIPSWKEGGEVVLFFLDYHRCPKCETTIGTRTVVEEYRKGKK